MGHLYQLHVGLGLQLRLGLRLRLRLGLGLQLRLGLGLGWDTFTIGNDKHSSSDHSIIAAPLNDEGATVRVKGGLPLPSFEVTSCANILIYIDIYALFCAIMNAKV